MERRLVWGVLLLAFVGCILLRVVVGGTDALALSTGFDALLGRGDATARTIVWEIRLPRAFAGLLIGALLAAVGSTFQALFRNPLADPFIVGVAAGASVGVAFASSAGWQGGPVGFPAIVAACATGLASLALVVSLAWRRGVISVNSLLLGGVVTGSLLSAITTLVLVRGGQDSNQVLRKLLGSLTPMYWPQVALLAAVALIGIPILYRETRSLNALAIGEDTAKSLGVDVRRIRNRVLIVGTLLASVTVGVAGIIGFLGLVTPHLARLWVGADWRRSMPVAIGLGGILLTLADLAAVRLGELQVGVVTAILGAPFLLILLRRGNAA